MQVALDPAQGREQRGVRPAIVISESAASHHQRFPLLVVVPLTSTLSLGPLYPEIQATTQSGLKNTSAALIDQLRAVDKTRVRALYGLTEQADMARVDHALRMLLAL